MHCPAFPGVVVTIRIDDCAACFAFRAPDSRIYPPVNNRNQIEAPVPTTIHQRNQTSPDRTVVGRGYISWLPPDARLDVKDELTQRTHTGACHQ